MTDTCNKIVAANVEKLPEITEFIEGCADQFGLDSKKKFGLLIAVEEAFVNVCNYSSLTGRGGLKFCVTGLTMRLSLKFWIQEALLMYYRFPTLIPLLILLTVKSGGLVAILSANFPTASVIGGEMIKTS